MDAVLIKSRSNPLVRRLRALKDKAGGELMLPEGPKPLREALASGVQVLEVAATPPPRRGVRQGMTTAGEGGVGPCGGGGAARQVQRGVRIGGEPPRQFGSVRPPQACHEPGLMHGGHRGVGDHAVLQLPRIIAGAGQQA